MNDMYAEDDDYEFAAEVSEIIEMMPPLTEHQQNRSLCTFGGNLAIAEATRTTGDLGTVTVAIPFAATAGAGCIAMNPRDNKGIRA
jgi:hypothetical protein